MRIPLPANKKNVRIIVAGDVHGLYADMQVVEVIRKVLHNTYVDFFVQVGDLLDMEVISRYVKGRAKEENKYTLLEEYAHTEKNIVHPWSKAACNKNPKAKSIYMTGNHCSGISGRLGDWLASHPQFQGLVEPNVHIDFEKYNGYYFDTWGTNELIDIGPISFTHGNYTNMHHAHKMANEYMRNIVYGHLHDFSRAYKRRHADDGDMYFMAQCAGLVAKKQQGYVGKRPTNWHQGFLDIQLNAKTNYFTINPVHITDGYCLFEGKEFSA